MLKFVTMTQQLSRELPKVPEYIDSTGRVVIPMAEEHCSDYVDAWKAYIENSHPETYARQNLRQLAKVALDCPVELAYGVGGICKAACAGLKVSKWVDLANNLLLSSSGLFLLSSYLICLCRPWVKRPGSPYTPFLWRNYEIGDFEYDLVVYRRPKRSMLCKIICCGA